MWKIFKKKTINRVCFMQVRILYILNKWDMRRWLCTVQWPMANGAEHEHTKLGILMEVLLQLFGDFTCIRMFDANQSPSFMISCFCKCVRFMSILHHLSFEMCEFFFIGFCFFFVHATQLHPQTKFKTKEIMCDEIQTIDC